MSYETISCVEALRRLIARGEGKITFPEIYNSLCLIYGKEETDESISYVSQQEGYLINRPES